jgi:DNA-binding NtrC family response regulator
MGRSIENSGVTARGGRILVVEDVHTLRDVLCSVLESQGFSVEGAGSVDEAARVASTNEFDCILCDFKLGAKTGLDLLADLRTRGFTTPFILLTAYGSIDIAVEAMKLGASDFITKPFEPTVLAQTLMQVVANPRNLDREPGTRSRRDRSFLTSSPAAQRVIDQAKKVARVDSSVLILGESGTGKELIARLIHHESPRRDKPFVAVNCGAIPAELLESELFGHEEGAFTGATQTRLGVFEIATEGTIFLDEIGDMPLQLQVKLLRTLQERELMRVGGTKVIRINPRVISATHRNIEEALNSGLLREDLYYRLAIVSLLIPPLRERQEDIPLLADHFTRYFSAQFGKAGMSLSPEAIDVLMGYAWPGNGRELENIIERAVILSDGVIGPDDLGVHYGLDMTSLQGAAATLLEVAGEAAKRAEMEAIMKVLSKTAGNKSKAARMLGVSYKTLLNKVKEYQIG